MGRLHFRTQCRRRTLPPTLPQNVPPTRSIRQIRRENRLVEPPSPQYLRTSPWHVRDVVLVRSERGVIRSEAAIDTSQTIPWIGS